MSDDRSPEQIDNRNLEREERRLARLRLVVALHPEPEQFDDPADDLDPDPDPDPQEAA